VLVASYFDEITRPTAYHRRMTHAAEMFMDEALAEAARSLDLDAFPVRAVVADCVRCARAGPCLAVLPEP
jgi:hypothetical protein